MISVDVTNDQSCVSFVTVAILCCSLWETNLLLKKTWIIDTEDYRFYSLKRIRCLNTLVELNLRTVVHHILMKELRWTYFCNPHAWWDGVNVSASVIPCCQGRHWYTHDRLATQHHTPYNLHLCSDLCKCGKAICLQHCDFTKNITGVCVFMNFKIDSVISTEETRDKCFHVLLLCIVFNIVVLL